MQIYARNGLSTLNFQYEVIKNRYVIYIRWDVAYARHTTRRP